MRCWLFVLLTLTFTVVPIAYGRQPPTRAQLLSMKLPSQRAPLANAVAVQGKYAYVGIGSRLVVVDISDPSHPAVVGHTRFSSTISWAHLSPNVSDVAVLGNYAYVVAGGLGAARYPDVHVVDVSDPAAPYVVGSFGTPQTALGVAVAGHYAYLLDHNAGLRVLDVSDPTRPTEVGYCKTPGQGVYPFLWQLGLHAAGGSYVTVAGDYAYVPDFNGGLRVIDVSDPADPRHVGSLGGSKTRPRGLPVTGVAVAGDYAYITNSRGLRVADISDPTAPQEVGSYALPQSARTSAAGVAVAGDYAYVYDRFYEPSSTLDGVWVVDVSDPTAPHEVDPGHGNSRAIQGNVHALALKGAYAYVGIGPRLMVMDISDLHRPVSLGGTVILTPNVIDLAVAGDYAYVALGTGGLRVLDISDPVTPQEVGFCAGPWLVVDMAVAGNYVYVADGVGLRVVDVSDPTAPHEVGFCEVPRGNDDRVLVDDVVYVVGKLVLAGDFVYVVGETRSRSLGAGRPLNSGFGPISVVDVSDPSAPTKVASLEIPGPPGDAEAVAVVGEYAYVVCRRPRHGLRVVKLSHMPFLPVWGAAALVSAVLLLLALRLRRSGRGFRFLLFMEDFANRHLPTFSRFRLLFAVALLLFVGALPPLAVLALVPTARHEVGFCYIPNATGVVMAGDYAYVVGWQLVQVGPVNQLATSLRVVDVSDPAAPTVVGSYTTPGSLDTATQAEVAVIGDYAYLAGTRGLRVVDISDPTATNEVGYFVTPGRVCGVAVAGNYAYVADGPAGLRVLDLSDPATPRKREVGFYDPAVPVGPVPPEI